MPFNPVPANPVRVTVHPVVGLAALSRTLLARVRGAGGEAPLVIAVDGMWGVDWEPFTDLVPGAAVVYTTDFLRPPGELRELLRPWLTENPVFGRICELPLSACFDVERLRAAVEAAGAGPGDRAPARPVLVVGPYALGACPGAHVGLYCDLPREEIIRRQQVAGLPNLGDDRALSAGARYKNAYYVEWPLLEAHKRALLQDPGSPVDWYADCSDPAAPVALSLADLRRAVADVASRPFRCKPVFMPGVWGGQRLREVGRLPEEWPNCAWDFEIVAPENGVTVDLGVVRMTIPFPVFMWLQARQIVGELVYRQFGEYFPLRINYLDTMGGTNLSLQVHPHHTYMRQEFGEPIGQDESYYIVERKPGARVYLGLREDATREKLREAVRKAEEEQIPFAITDYVNAFEANVGDLFLIPAGTIHCSGADNLVLEISTTPYWYTFKIYDYLRPDLDGQPRPINSAHAFEVIDFTRKTAWVRRHLVPRPFLLRREAGGAEYHVGSTALTFYSVHRLHVETEMADDTRGGFVLLTVVQGEGARVLAPDGEGIGEMAYLETWVVPASVGAYRLQPAGGQPCQVVKTFVRQ